MTATAVVASARPKTTTRRTVPWMPLADAEPVMRVLSTPAPHAARCGGGRWDPARAGRPEATLPGSGRRAPYARRRAAEGRQERRHLERLRDPGGQIGRASCGA